MLVQCKQNSRFSPIGWCVLGVIDIGTLKNLLIVMADKRSRDDTLRNAVGGVPTLKELSLYSLITKQMLADIGCTLQL